MNTQLSPNLLVVLGPTASGKTRLGVHLADALSGEILSVDSRQVYRGLDIGAGKDLEEYIVGTRTIPCHLIDIVGLSEEYNVFAFQRDFYAAFEEISARGALPIAVGGTGLYLDAVLKGYRMVEVPENKALREELSTLPHGALSDRLDAVRGAVHNTTDYTDRDRLVRAIEIAEYSAKEFALPPPRIHLLIMGVRWTRAVLRERIRERLRFRLNHGLIEEVQGLLDQGVSPERLDALGLEYRFVLHFLEGQIKSRNDLEQKLAVAIGQFAKRQDTWFRRMERQGTEIHWIDEGNPDHALALARDWLAR